MSLKFYTDVHVPLNAVKQLRLKGVDIIHCGEVGLSNADDSIHFRYAIENQRVMVSCDYDFEHLHVEVLVEGNSHFGVVYFRMNDQCQSISTIVNEIQMLHEISEAEADLSNQFWRVTS